VIDFWDWALQAYAREGAASACLALQDDHAQSVPFLLWAAWAALEGRWPDADRLTRAAALAQAWEASTIGPLRQARRAAKSPLPDMDDAPRAAVREQIRSVELAAERALMDALQALTPTDGKTPPVGLALQQAVVAWNRPAPADAIKALATMLS
jgi:uncharacterized protein (TIGR02444 family)